jgi:hypothetical protein
MRTLPISVSKMTNLELIKISSVGTDGRRIILTEKTIHRIKNVATAYKGVLEITEGLVNILKPDSYALIPENVKDILKDLDFKTNINKLL